MDEKLRERLRQRAQDPQDRAAAEALARARLRTAEPESAALVELTRTALGYLAKRSPGSGNAAGLADLLLASNPDWHMSPGERASLERLRPFLGEARALDGPPELMPLIFLDPPHARLEVFDEFFNYAREFGGNSGGYEWRYQLLPLPEARGLDDVGAVARILLSDQLSLTHKRRPRLNEAAARAAQGLRQALPSFRGFPEGLDEVLRALIVLSLGSEWRLYDPGIHTARTTRCDYQLMRFGEDWFAIEQFFD